MVDKHTIQLDIPQHLYQHVQQRASQTRRSVEDEVLAVVEHAFAQDVGQQEWEQISPDILFEVQQLAFLDNQALWQAARQTATTQSAARMQELLRKQKMEGLTEPERQEVTQLQLYAQRLMLVRAEAAVLLRQRGIDISSLRQPTNS